MEDVELLKIEEAALNAWPAPLQMLYDGWVLRFTGGHSKRVNSVNPLYASRLPLDEKIKTCERVYARLGLPCLFRVPEPVADSPLTDALTTRATRLLTRRSCWDAGWKKGVDLADVTILEMSHEDWFQMRAHLSAYLMRTCRHGHFAMYCARDANCWVCLSTVSRSPVG